MGEMIPDQQGRIVVVVQAPPGVGFDPAYALENSVRWRLRSVQATLVTGADVVNRVPELTITQNGSEVLRITASQSIGANSVFIFGWMEGERAFAVTGQTSRVTALPRRFYMNNSAVVAIATVGLAMADSWGNMVISAEEWIEPMA